MTKNLVYIAPNGAPLRIEAKNESLGAEDAGKIPMLGEDGRVHHSMAPALPVLESAPIDSLPYAQDFALSGTITGGEITLSYGGRTTAPLPVLLADYTGGYPEALATFYSELLAILNDGEGVDENAFYFDFSSGKLSGFGFWHTDTLAHEDVTVDIAGVTGTGVSSSSTSEEPVQGTFNGCPTGFQILYPSGNKYFVAVNVSLNPKLVLWFYLNASGVGG